MNIHRGWHQILILAFFALMALPLRARERADTALLHRVFHYAATVDTTHMQGYATYAYNRFTIDIDKKNPLLMLVPSLYVIAHGHNRHYISETFSNNIYKRRRSDTQVLLHTTTIPRGRQAWDRVLSYLYPNIYNTTIIENYLLSPFHADNRKFYRYRVAFLLNGTARITFRPRRDNTQLVSGEALVDYYTGRVLRCTLKGEYDMIDFTLNITPGDKGFTTLLPQQCEAETRFGLLGNKLRAQALACYHRPKPPVDSFPKRDDYELMSSLRPDTLSPKELQLYTQMFTEKYKRDSVELTKVNMPKKHDFVKDVLWDVIGNNALNRFKSNFGVNNQGYIRLNPVLNPLYMSYDHNRGITYKIDLRGNYQFSDQKEITLRFRGGYAFKQHRFYWRVPLYYYFHKRKNAYLKLEVGNGNNIHSDKVRNDIQKELPDTSQLSTILDRLHEFRQADGRLVLNYDANSIFGIQLGLLFQQRTAVNKLEFRRFGWTDTYRSFAPAVQLQYRPGGWDGPIFTIDYDRSFKGILRSNTAYERWEMNGEYIYRFNRLQSLQAHGGLGFYSSKGKRAYFLSYENFRENNIPGGWNDDWSGQFELLRSSTYESSDYYLRMNLTYESPLLFLSWVPWAGHYIEMERFYVSALDAHHVHPYIEVGYGFTTRVFSVGLFTSNGRGNRVFGCKFGFELFRKW
ncbi:DUF5686 family protein [Hallella mizrahii]|nr:DUF5686 family protein [Hallella mizrahii]